jgi:hypothetical protein
VREGRRQEAEVRRQEAGRIKYILPSDDVLRQEAELLRTSEKSDSGNHTFGLQIYLNKHYVCL